MVSFRIFPTDTLHGIDICQCDGVTALSYTSLWLGVPAHLTDTFTAWIPKVSDFKVRRKEHAKHLVNEEAIAGRFGGWEGRINAMPWILSLLPCIVVRVQHGGHANTPYAAIQSHSSHASR